MVVFSLQEVLYVCIFQYKGKHVLYPMVTGPIKEHNTLEADQKEESRRESCDVRLPIDSLTSMLSSNKDLNRDVEAGTRGQQECWV